MKKKIIIILLCLPLVCFAQFKINSRAQDISTRLRTGGGMGQGLVGLLGLDPSRVSMHHSYQMAFSSMGGRNFSQGLYLNTLTYEFSIPMTLSVQWGIANELIPGLNSQGLMNNGPFISGAQLEYRPTKNTLIHLEYRQLPGGYDYLYGSPYRYGRYRNSFFDEW